VRRDCFGGWRARDGPAWISPAFYCETD
jgi:hypothetical protein